MQLINARMVVLVTGKQNVKMPFRRMRNRSNSESDWGTVFGRNQVVQHPAATTDTKDGGGTMVELSREVLFSDGLY